MYDSQAGQCHTGYVLLTLNNDYAIMNMIGAPSLPVPVVPATSSGERWRYQSGVIMSHRQGTLYPVRTNNVKPPKYTGSIYNGAVH